MEILTRAEFRRDERVIQADEYVQDLPLLRLLEKLDEYSLNYKRSEKFLRVRLYRFLVYQFYPHPSLAWDPAHDERASDDAFYTEGYRCPSLIS